jgi:UPF0716 protein FxsA
MFKKLLLIFIVVPLLELYILIKIGQLLGAEVTITLVVVTGILGAVFVRAQGFSLVAKIKLDLSEGTLPHKRLLEGVCILASGLLLLTPGLITDLVGFMLLIPPLRNRMINTMLKKARTYISTAGSPPVTWTYQNRFPDS